MTRGPLSETSQQAIARTVTRSLQDGVDLWEELNKVGYLATEPRVQEIEVSALKNAFDRFETMSADDFLRHINWHQNNSNPATPADLLNAIRAWFISYIDYIAHD